MAPIAGLALGGISSLLADPASFAQTALAATVVVGGVGGIALGYFGHRINKHGFDRKFYVLGSGWGISQLGGGGGGSGSGDGGSGSNGAGQAPGDVTGRDKVRAVITEAASKAGVPNSWIDPGSDTWKIWGRESSSTPEKLNCSAVNPSSGALGPGQLNPSSGTAKQYGVNQKSSCVDKTAASLRYIKDRYGTPAVAWRFWQRNHWY